MSVEPAVAEVAAKRLRRLVMLGFLVEPNYFRKYSQSEPYPQVAAYKLEERYVEGLQRAGLVVDVIASAALSAFPWNRRLYFPFLNWSAGAVRWVLPSLNLPFLNMAGRFVGSFVALILRLQRHSEATAVCVYSAHSPFLLAAFLASRLRRVNFFVIIPDLPRYMRSKEKSSALLDAAKRLDERLINALVARSNGVSVVTKNMVVDTPAWSRVRYMVIEGLASAAGAETATDHTGRRPYFMYAGALIGSNGVQALIDGFCATDIDADLLLCGRGELEAYIKTRARQDQRVKYGGFLDQRELALLQRNAIALVLARDPGDAYTRYSFPSKLIEYMSSGAPVLTTNLPGIPAEYLPYLNIIDSADPGIIATALKSFMAQPASVVKSRAEAGRAFVLDRCDPDRTMKSFAVFLESA